MFEGGRVQNRSTCCKTLASEQDDCWEVSCTIEEIKNVDWWCGGDKTPHPDGFFFFKFVERYWDLLKKYIFDGSFFG